MARFLSPEWFEDVARQTPADTGDPVVLTLEQRVTDGPEGEVRYRVLVGGAGARIVPPALGDANPPDVVITTDWATAAAVASGRLSTQAALGAGHLRIGGDLGALADHQAELAGADPVPAAVRASTDWGAPAGPGGPRGGIDSRRGAGRGGGGGTGPGGGAAGTTGGAAW